MPRTKIVATIGPASESEDVLRAMLMAGMNVARINMSHGEHDEHRRRIERLRQIAADLKRHIAILADLQGPKLRIGSIAGGEAILSEGQPFTLTTSDIEGSAERVTAPYPALAHDARPGDRILLGDGNVELRVVATTHDSVATRVVHGGPVRSHQGVNLLGVTASLQSLTERDRRDLAYILGVGVDYVALSFVRHPRDIQELRYAMLQAGHRLPIVAKIEKVEALENIDAIIAAADAIMVARGDLGIEMELERVPVAQKMIIRKARLAAKPVITATQMLESMTHNPRPTRAEASDVANAILDGTDAVMLSGETAIGAFPVACVETMTDIAEATEKTIDFEGNIHAVTRVGASSITDAISQATVEVAWELHARAIFAATATGATAQAVARWRPETPIIGTTFDPAIACRLALVWGVLPLVVPAAQSQEELIRSAIVGGRAAGRIHAGDLVVMTGGLPVGVPGQTNSLRVHTVDGE